MKAVHSIGAACESLQTLTERPSAAVACGHEGVWDRELSLSVHMLLCCVISYRALVLERP